MLPCRVRQAFQARFCLLSAHIDIRRENNKKINSQEREREDEEKWRERGRKKVRERKI